jgi:hypothetical protein
MSRTWHVLNPPSNLNRPESTRFEAVGAASCRDSLGGLSNRLPAALFRAWKALLQKLAVDLGCPQIHYHLAAFFIFGLE